MKKSLLYRVADTKVDTHFMIVQNNRLNMSTLVFRENKYKGKIYFLIPTPSMTGWP